MCPRPQCRILCLLALLLSHAAVAQTIYGTIRGWTLLKSTGQPAASVLVLVSSLDQGELQQFSAQTNTSGEFTVNNLPLGAYKISMKKDGCKTWEEPYVPVSADSTSEIKVQLTQGSPTETFTDDGSAVSILKLDRTDVSTSFSLHEIDSLPIFLQNVSLYDLLVPGAERTRTVLPPEQNPQGGVYASLSGQHFSGTTVMVDGTVDRDPLEGLVVLNPSLDSVAELKITTQNYSAEFGPATGGVVNIQTRSGTNQIHGSAFEYRVSGFGQADVANFGQTSSLLGAPEKRNDFGGSLGGPLIHDRLFLFGDYRGIRSSADGTVLLTVPTSTVHTTCTGNPTDPPCDLSAYTAAGAGCSGLCSGGMIPNSAVSPQMVNFLNLIPLPNAGPTGALTNNFVASGGDFFSNDNFDVRGDYVISKKLRTFARYSFSDFRENGTPAFGNDLGGLGVNPTGFAGVMRDRNQGVAAGGSFSFSPSLLTDFRFGFFRYNLGLNSLDLGTTPATAASINGLNFPQQPLYTSGMPDIQLDNPSLPNLPIAGNIDFLRLGYSSVANSCDCPLTEREQQFQFVDNWTRVVGTHNFRWGADFRYLQNFRLDSTTRPAGHLEFGTSVTGFSLGDFLVGGLESFGRAYNNPNNPAALDAGERQKRLFLYGEDTWRVTPRLTINYGLRWEIYFPQSVTAPGAGGWLQLGSGATPFQDQFLVAGQGGANLQGGVQTTFHNLGPRLGFAYLLNKKTVIRAGYGRMFDTGYAGSIFGIAATQSPPVGVVATLPAGFTVNSNAAPTTANPIDICTLPQMPVSGPCTVPAFNFPTSAPFTISNIYSLNSIYSPNPNLSEVQAANLYALPGRLRLPTVDAWNVALQEQLDKHMYLEISYVANKGTHVLNDSTGGGSQAPFYDLNEPTLANYIAPIQSVPAGDCQGSAKILKTISYCKTQPLYRQAFNPWSGEVLYFGDNASSNYNSLQVKLRRQFHAGVSLEATYTWAKVIDFDNLYFALDPAISRGVGNFDREHDFVMTNIWDLPIGKGHHLAGGAGPVLDRVVGGWSLAAITNVSSGLPFTPTYSECGPDIGASNFRPCRPDLVGTVAITGNPNQYFTTTGGATLHASCTVSGSGDCPSTTAPAFQGFSTTTGAPLLGQIIGPWQRPGAGQIGNVGRNSLRGPGFFQSDLAIAKNFPVTEHVALQFRADAFNVFNRLNLGQPNPNVDAGSGAGAITSTIFGSIPRQLQFSLRANF